MASKRETPSAGRAAHREAGRGPSDQRRQLLQLIVGAVALGVSFAVVLILLNSRGGDDEPTGDRTTIKAPATEIDASVARDGRTLGDPAASILVAEYADYQCPFCTNFALTGMPKLIEDYIATGRVRLEYHHFVVIGSNDPDGESYRAAEAAECARDQGRFWEYHELLFTNSLGEFQGSFTPDRLKAIAQRAPGLDQTAFAGCVDARTHQGAVAQMVAEGRLAGVRATPTFIVNGQPVSGGYDDLKAVIDEQITGS